MNKKWMLNIVLLLSAAVIAIVPLVIVKDSTFEGADGKAVEIVEEINEGFQPWYKPFWEPPGGETESFFFAVQAAIGSGVIFYCIGYLKGRREGRKDGNLQK